MASKGAWRQYKAPNGRKYYYNIDTKETTWVNPFRIERTAKIPVFVIPLLNCWYLIIYDNGEKSYLSDNVLYNRLNDSDSVRLIEEMDKNLLLLLIGVARGYKSSRGSDYVYEEILQEIQKIKDRWNNENLPNIKESNDPEIESQEESQVEEEEAKMTEGETMVDTLISGYSSSEDDDDDHIDKKLKIEEEYSFKIDESIVKQYKEMFTRYNLNPYSLWSIEMDKCSKDPTFYLIADDNDREMIFESWCGDFKISESESESEIEDEDDLIPTKFHYLSHIISKSNISKETIFEDIKGEQKQLWKQFKINKMIPDKKEQREFVVNLLFYYKRYTLEERRKIFLKWVKKNCKLDDTSRLKLSSSTLKHWKKLYLNENSSKDIETLLLSLEKYLNISELVQEDKDNPLEYYLLGIKDKCHVLYDNVVGQES